MGILWGVILGDNSLAELLMDVIIGDDLTTITI